MKIKLFLLSLVAGLSFVGFSSADFDNEFIYSYGSFYPSAFNVNGESTLNFSVDSSNVLLNSPLDYYIEFYGNGSLADEDGGGCSSEDGPLDEVSVPFAQHVSVNIPDGTSCIYYNFSITSEDESVIENLDSLMSDIEFNVVVSDSVLTPPVNPNPEEVPGGSSSGSSLLPAGSLTPVITNLGTTVSEFIPYIVYIGLGILGAIIGFVAIKWLINRIRSKTLSPFR